MKPVVEQGWRQDKNQVPIMFLHRQTEGKISFKGFSDEVSDEIQGWTDDMMEEKVKMGR